MHILVLDNTPDLQFREVFDHLLGSKHEIITVNTVETAISNIRARVYGAIFITNIKGRHLSIYEFIEALKTSSVNRQANVIVLNDMSSISQRIKASFGGRVVHFIAKEYLEELLKGVT